MTIRTAVGLESVVDGLPRICGHWDRIEEAALARGPVYLEETDVDLSRVGSAFALALHMHQPTIPGGGDDLATAGLIGHLQWMFEHPDLFDNHNAGPFASCYERMGDFIPQLIGQGKSPRIMLDYSGNLLWGLEQMGRRDILDKLADITCHPTYRRHVEWLGTMWGHAVVSSTPPADIALHVRAWQEYFAATFGTEALSRVRGFSPPEMHLPNDPEVAYTYLKALLDAGYTWLLVQEHTVEKLDGSGISRPHLPHRLVARNSDGQTVSITALVKTQGSDNKLVAQVQPLSEARTLSRQELGGVSIPPLVTQIGDGENGGVMMNEFPQAYLGRMAELGSEGVVALNGTEYLELVQAAGVKPDEFIPIQPIHQHAIWSRIASRGLQSARTEVHGSHSAAYNRAVETAEREVPGFHLDGGSWTNSTSWVSGYQRVLDPMNQLSAEFHKRLATSRGRDSARTQVRGSSPAYREALLYLLISQTSCFRYWGEGRWGDYARELCRRGKNVLERSF